MANFLVPLVEDKLFAKQLLSKLQDTADKLGIQEIKIFTDEVLFQNVSVNKFKDLGNNRNILKELKIKLADPIENVTCEERQKELIQRYHVDPLTGGHFGATKILNKLRFHYTWKSMNAQVQDFVKLCSQCQLNRPKARTIEPFVVTDTPQQPFDNVSIDTIGPMRKSKNDNKYALTMMCDLTKYVIIAPIVNKEANTVARAVFENLVLTHGPINRLLTDQGTEYCNAIMQELCKSLNIKHNKSTAYHHETLGAVERSHRTFNEYLRSYLSDDTDWEECLRYFAYCYNTSHHSAFNFKFTPFELVYARKANLPEFLQTQKIDPVYNLDNFAKEAKFRLQVTAQAAQKLLEKN